MHQRAWHRDGRGLVLGCVLSALCWSCGGAEGGLHVIVDGTLEPGIDLDRLVIRAHRSGEERPLMEEVFEADGLRPLPVTLNLLSGPQTPAGTRVRVVVLAQLSEELVRAVEGEATLAEGTGQILRLDLGGPEPDTIPHAAPDAGMDAGFDGGVDGGPDAGFPDDAGADDGGDAGAADAGAVDSDGGADDGGLDPDAGDGDAGLQVDAGSPDSSVPSDAGFVIPGVIEAEDYLPGGQGIGYFDTTAGNIGGGCRNEDVDMKANTPESDAGCIVGWFENGEWLAYPVDVVQGGAYALHARVARGAKGNSSFHLLMDGIDVSGPVVVSSTGAWNSFTTITKSGLQLMPGAQQLKVVNDGGPLDLDWIQFEFQGP